MNKMTLLFVAMVALMTINSFPPKAEAKGKKKEVVAEYQVKMPDITSAPGLEQLCWLQCEGYSDGTCACERHPFCRWEQTGCAVKCTWGKDCPEDKTPDKGDKAFKAYARKKYSTKSVDDVVIQCTQHRNGSCECNPVPEGYYPLKYDDWFEKCGVRNQKEGKKKSGK